MPQGNLGYKSNTHGRFAINDIIQESKFHFRNGEVDLENFKDPFPALEFLIAMAIGAKEMGTSQDCQDAWDRKLVNFIWKLKQNGYTTRKVNGLVTAIMNKTRLGVEVYRCMGGNYLR